jgi:hypothetical protein
LIGCIPASPESDPARHPWRGGIVMTAIIVKSLGGSEPRRAGLTFQLMEHASHTRQASISADMIFAIRAAAHGRGTRNM